MINLIFEFLILNLQLHTIKEQQSSKSYWSKILTQPELIILLWIHLTYSAFYYHLSLSLILIQSLAYLFYYDKNIINKHLTLTHSRMDYLNLLLLIVTIIRAEWCFLFPFILWQLVNNKANYTMDDILICLYIGILTSVASILSVDILVAKLFNLLIPLAATLSIAYAMGGKNLNISNLFCLKTPKKNQFYRILIKFGLYCLSSLLTIFCFSPIDVFLIIYMAIYYPASSLLYLSILAQTYLEESIWRLFVIKLSINENNQINTPLAIALSLISAVLFSYAHRFNAPVKAIMKSSYSLWVKCVEIFIQYGCKYLISSLNDIFISGHILGSECIHFINNLIGFTQIIAYESEETKFSKKAYEINLTSSFKENSIFASSILVPSKISDVAVKLFGYNLDIEYESQKVPDTEKENKNSFIS